MASTNDHKTEHIPLCSSSVLMSLVLSAAAIGLSGCAAVVAGKSPLLEATAGTPTLIEIYRAKTQGVSAGANERDGGNKTPRDLMQDRSAVDTRTKDGGQIGYITNGGPVYVERSAPIAQAVITTPITAQIATGKGPGDVKSSGSPYWEAVAPLQQRFARVPNPDLVMVVFPHMNKQNYPVPGYVTVFPMYEQTLYALPGEIQEDR